jgi:hypothetical protein
VKPARRLLSLSMKTIQYLYRQLPELLRFGQETILYALIFVSVFFRNRASLGCELVAVRSQLIFFKEGIRQKKHPGRGLPRLSVSCGCCCQQSGMGGNLLQI